VQDFKCKAKEHALKERPRESCGVVVKGRYYPCQNIADEPENHFIIETRDYVTARTNGKIEAIVHSHPKGGEASAADKRAFLKTKIPWYIYLIPKDKWLIMTP
tara:strand:+ start:4424 stop:4732 length:309 start_codon:yes stop_codon:yes gene_type:complete